MQNIYKLALALTSKEIGKVDVYVVHDHIAGYILINNLFKPSFFYNSAMSSQLFELSMKSWTSWNIPEHSGTLKNY